MPQKTPCVPIKTQKRINPRPLRTQAKYGVTGGICALFSLCRNNRLNTAGLHVFTLPVGRVRASQTTGRRQSRPPAAAARRAVALHPLTFFEKKVSKETLIFNERNFMKDKKLSIRISEQDLAAIHRKAVTAKLSFTDYVTRSCLNRQIVVIDGLEDIIREKKAIGRNLNRLTLLCNMGKVSVVSLGEVKEQYARLNELLCSLLERKR